MTATALKRVKRRESPVESSYMVDSKELEISINMASVNFIIEKLTDMYSNKSLSIVRELVSNSIDAGATEITINTPTVLNPKLEIIDNGCGMSMDLLSNVYRFYGSSDKQDDLDSIGAFGLGAKVPLCYTTEFMLETSDGHEKIITTVGRRENGFSMKIWSHETGTFPSGTKVSLTINADDFRAFEEAAESYRIVADIIGDDSGYKINTPNISPASSKGTFVRLGDLNIGGHEFPFYSSLEGVVTFRDVESGHFRRNTRLVIGGFPYDIVNTTSNRWDQAAPVSCSHYFIVVDPGFLDFISSRESLDFTARTNSFIDSIISLPSGSEVSEVGREIQKCLENYDLRYFYREAVENPQNPIRYNYQKGSVIIKERLYSEGRYFKILFHKLQSEHNNIFYELRGDHRGVVSASATDRIRKKDIDYERSSGLISFFELEPELVSRYRDKNTFKYIAGPLTAEERKFILAGKTNYECIFEIDSKGFDEDWFGFKLTDFADFKKETLKYRSKDVKTRRNEDLETRFKLNYGSRRWFNTATGNYYPHDEALGLEPDVIICTNRAIEWSWPKSRNNLITTLSLTYPNKIVYIAVDSALVMAHNYYTSEFPDAIVKIWKTSNATSSDDRELQPKLHGDFDVEEEVKYLISELMYYDDRIPTGADSPLRATYRFFGIPDDYAPVLYNFDRDVSNRINSSDNPFERFLREIELVLYYIRDTFFKRYSNSRCANLLSEETKKLVIIEILEKSIDKGNLREDLSKIRQIIQK